MSFKLLKIGRTALVAATVCVALAPSPSWATQLKMPYASPMYRMGSSANDSASTLTTTPKLAFPGMTLDDIVELVDDGYVFGATQCGTSWHRKSVFQARDVLVCRNPETDAITMISVLFVSVHDGHTKSVAVELTDGDGGVYARAGRAQYLSKKSDPAFAFVVPDGNGGVIYSCDTSNAGKASAGTIATYDGGGYGFCSLTLLKLPKTSARSLAFANAPGEPVLTVDDIRDYDFSSRFCGYSVAISYIGSVAKGYNPTVLETVNGRATRMSVDFQIAEGQYTKCVVVEFSNGEDGVYAHAVKTLYAGASTLPLGSSSASSGWTVNTTQPAEYYGVAATTTSAYGVFALSAAPSDAPKAYWNAVENKIASTHRVIDVTTQLPLLTGTWVKMLDGTSLQEMVDDGYEISAYMCGGSVNTKQRVYAKGFQSFTPAGETSISNAICWFAILDDGHTKSATIEMETRADGVYAKYGKGQYLYKVRNLGFNFAWLDENGNPVYDCDQENKTATFDRGVPATWTGAGYGVAGLKASRYMKKDESRLVFRNPVGEPVLTLDDIKGYYLGCSFAAASISDNDCEGVGLYRAFEYDGDSVRSMRVEYQVYDGGWNKCVIVNFTNGVDGVYGYAAAAGHYGKGSGVLGHHFVNASGAFVDCPDAVATAYDGATGYGIYDLFAAPMVTLERDTDWSGIGGVVPLGDAVVDLNGHSLTLQGVSGNKYTYSQIFNSNNSVMSEVHFNVSGGLTFSNNSVRFGTSNAFLNNNIEFVKEGNGTFVGAIGQPCKGGMQFVAGTLKAGVAGTSNPFGATPQTFELDAGLVFDINGQWDFNAYTFVLNGGKLTNTGTDNTNVQGQFKTVTLTADSSFVLPHSCGMIGSSYVATTLDLAGHKLTVDVSSGKSFFLSNATISNGTIELRNDAGDGKLLTGQDGGNASANGTNHAETVDFKVGCALWLYAPLSVRNYEALYDRNSNNGRAAFNIHGAFKPSAHDYFHGCTMMDGSTIDLSLRESALPLVSAFTNTNSDRTLKFADGATVYMALGGKRFAGGKVISWEARPENVGTVKFRNAPGESKRTFTAKDDGLYMTSGGLMVLVR